METQKTLIERYFDLQSEIFKHVGYVEDWKIIPLDNHLGNYWMICGPEDSSSTSVVWSGIPFTKETLEAGKAIYSGTIYTQRFLPKWVYRGRDFTLVSIDTHCDDNKCLMIFDNNLECKDQSLMSIYNDCW